MRNALILQGSENTPEGNWYPWLKGELEKRGFRVWLPALPQPEFPMQREWLHAVFSRDDWIFNEMSLIIGHSLGATLALRILENLPIGITIEESILVAGFVELGSIPETFAEKKRFLEVPFDWQRIKAACNRFCYVCSDNDSYGCGEDQGKMMQGHLGGELMVKKGQGHFNLEKGPQCKQFPLLLELI